MAKWIVYINQGLRGWQKYKEFTNPMSADLEVILLCQVHGYSCTDFTIKRVKEN